MAFFRNDAINRVYLHWAVQAFAQAGGQVFVLAYLLHAGVPVWAALALQSAILAGRFVLRPLVLPLAQWWGLKPLAITGALLMAAQYPVLAAVRGMGPELLALCVVTVIGDVFYWVSFHAWFSMLGDAEHRGHQVSASGMVSSLAGVISPLAGAWALQSLGPGVMFSAVGVIQALSALPLLGIPNVAVRGVAPGAFRAAWLGFALSACDGWFAAWHIVVWQVVLFLSLKQDFSAYGGAMALAALVGAGCGVLLGRHIDGGGGRRAVAIAYAFAGLVAVARALSFGSPWLAVAANAAGPFALAMIGPAMGTVSYNLGKASPCVMRFFMAAEAGQDVGCASACLLAAALAASGVSLFATLLLALPALALSAWLLRRYYARAAFA